MIHRKLLALILAPLASLALLSSNAHAQTGAAERIGPCVALRVVDGDSADLRCGAELVRVRMRNVAAPRPGQVGYTEAVRGLAELLRARELYVVSDVPGELPLDPNGRVLAYLCDRTGSNLNIAFVLLGWATYSTDAGAGRLEKSFRAAEQEAHSERRALWSVWSVSAGGVPGR
jgi:endonuclease YncB( thermonuclease family)